MWNCHKDRQWNSIENPEVNPVSSGWGRIVCVTDDTRITGYISQKNEVGPCLHRREKLTQKGSKT